MTVWWLLVIGPLTGTAAYVFAEWIAPRCVQLVDEDGVPVRREES